MTTISVQACCLPRYLVDMLSQDSCDHAPIMAQNAAQQAMELQTDVSRMHA